MVQKLFYLRNNGNITGPFTFEQLKKMQNSHLLNTQDMVSENRVSWQSIEEFLTVLPKNKKTGKKRTMELRPEEMPAPKYGISAVSADFPVKKTGSEIRQRAEKESRKDKPVIIPDPVCAAIAMCWNAPKQIDNIYQMQKITTSGKRKNDAFIYASITAAFIVLLLFGMELALSYIFIPDYFIAMLVMPLVLATGAGLIIWLENLCLSAMTNSARLVEVPLVLMMIILTSSGIFAAGMPFLALNITGTDNLPAAVNVIVILFSVLIMIAVMFNMAAGFIRINKNSFKMKNFPAVMVIMVLLIQFILLFFAGNGFVKFIKNI